MATVAAATRPMIPRNGMPVRVSAARAMMTVRPAKVTALPEVPTASAIDAGDRHSVAQLLDGAG